MSMAMLAGAMSGIGQNMHEQNLLQMQQDLDRRKLAHQELLQQSQRPDVIPEAQRILMQGSMDVLDPSKKVDKVFGDTMNSALNVHVKAGSASYPQQQQQIPLQNMPIPSELPAPTPPPGTETAGPAPAPATHTPPAASISGMMPTPPPVGQSDIVRSGYRSPMEQAQLAANLKGLETSATSEAQLQAKMAEQQAMTDWLASLPRDKQRAAFIAMGHTPPNVMSVAGTVPGTAIMQEFPQDSAGNPIDPLLEYHIGRDPFTQQIAYAFPESPKAKPEEWRADADSKTGYSRLYRNPRGDIVHVERDLQPPREVAGSVTTTNAPHFVVQPDNTIKEVYATTTTSRMPSTGGAPRTTAPAPPPGAGPTNIPAPAPAPPPGTAPAPGAAAPPSRGGAGRTVGGHGLPEGEKATLTKQSRAQMNTLALTNRVLKNLPMLNNLIDAGKIGMAISPSTGELVLSRLGKMTPAQEKFAGDVQTLSEDVNVLRVVFNAAGFKGPEAFAALQAQKGTLAGRPGVSQQVLLNMQRALLSVLSGSNESLTNSGKPLKPDDDLLRAYLNVNGNDYNAAHEHMLRDGWPAQ